MCHSSTLLEMRQTVNTPTAALQLKALAFYKLMGSGKSDLMFVASYSFGAHSKAVTVLLRHIYSFSMTWACHGWLCWWIHVAETGCTHLVTEHSQLCSNWKEAPPQLHLQSVWGPGMAPC